LRRDRTAEIAAVFHRKLRDGAFGGAAFREVMAQFVEDSAQQLWDVAPSHPRPGGTSSHAFARLPKSVFLRAADALHLTCAQEHGLWEIYTNDRHMSSAARHFKLKPATVVVR
jgi:predicted nucleic acid-binding protein